MDKLRDEAKKEKLANRREREVLKKFQQREVHFSTPVLVNFSSDIGGSLESRHKQGWLSKFFSSGPDWPL